MAHTIFHGTELLPETTPVKQLLFCCMAWVRTPPIYCHWPPDCLSAIMKSLAKKCGLSLLLLLLPDIHYFRILMLVGNRIISDCQYEKPFWASSRFFPCAPHVIVHDSPGVVAVMTAIPLDQCSPLGVPTLY
jgi:hypothetical protein